MEIQRQSDAPKLNSPDGAVSLIHGRNLATGRRLSPLFDPYASDSSGSPSPLLKYLCSAGPKFVSSPSFMTPVKVEEDVIVMDGVPVKKSNKRSGEARMRSPLMSSSSFNSNRFGGSSDSTPSPSSAAAGIENVRPHSNRLRRRCWKTCRCGTCRFSSDRQLAHGKEELQLPPRYSGKIKFEIFESNNNLEGSASPSYGNNYSPINQVKSLSPSAAGGGEEALPLLSPPAAMVLSSPPAQAKPFSGTAVTSRTIPNAYPRRSYWSPQDDGIEVALPRSSMEVRNLSKEDVDAYIENVLSGTTSRKRLPVFVEICPE